jgi:uracil-DNA glycosylase
MCQASDFVKALQAVPAREGVFNPWAQHDTEYDASSSSPEWRAEHLHAYLAERVGRAKWLLIAEAPGYQGCHFSGIAMTSERILLGGLAGKGIAAADVIATPPRRTSHTDKLPAGGANEPTATVIWSQLKSLGLDTREVVLWNAFAFHPHKPGAWLTNRAPTRAEVASGRALLEQFVALYAQAAVVAVGRVSQGLLGELGIHAQDVRHPSMGGATKFREQFAAIAGCAPKPQ